MNKKILSIVSIIALVAILTIVFVGCNADSYVSKLEKAGFTAEAIEAKDFEDFDLEEGKVEWAVMGNKNLIENVIIVKFADKASVEEIEDVDTALFKVVKKGKIVITGTPDAVDAVA